MTRARKKSRSTDLAAPAAGRSLAFGPPPLLAGEDRAGYTDLFEEVLAFVQPGDPFEEIWVHDLVNYSWEGARLRRLKASLLNAEARQRLVSALEEAVADDAEDTDEDGVEDTNQDDEDAAAKVDESTTDDCDAEEEHGIDVEELVEQWSLGRRGAVRKVGSLLASAGRSIDGIVAETFAEHIDFIDCIDRLIALAEARRCAVLRELQRHRVALGGPGQRLSQVEHAACDAVEPPADQRKQSL